MNFSKHLNNARPFWVYAALAILTGITAVSGSYYQDPILAWLGSIRAWWGMPVTVVNIIMMYILLPILALGFAVTFGYKVGRAETNEKNSEKNQLVVVDPHIEALKKYTDAVDSERSRKAFERMKPLPKTNFEIVLEYIKKAEQTAKQKSERISDGVYKEFQDFQKKFCDGLGCAIEKNLVFEIHNDMSSILQNNYSAIVYSNSSANQKIFTDTALYLHDLPVKKIHPTSLLKDAELKNLKFYEV